MKRIGFKNFRRFANFPVMELAPITIFVGENNSGKSTVVKGILALSDFFTRWRADYDLLIERNTDDEKKRKRIIKEKLADQKFYFNTSYLTHIGTFKRALYNKAEDNTISFHTSLGSMDIEINVKGEVPILTTRNLLLFPGVISPILIGRKSSLALVERLKEHPDITLYCLDNSHNKGGVRVSIEEALTWDYTITEEVENKLNDIMQEFINSGKLTPAQIQALIAE